MRFTFLSFCLKVSYLYKNTPIYKINIYKGKIFL